MITLLDKILSYFRNPTMDWPETGKQELVYDLRYLSINGYCINSRIELARQFGKCKYVKRLRKEYLGLFYPDSGLILQFASEELMAITAIVGPDSFHVSDDKMELSEMAIINTSGRNNTLNEATTLKDLVLYLGEPVESRAVGNDMVHTFIIGKNFIDSYHHSETGRLLHVEICETNETDSN